MHPYLEGLVSSGYTIGAILCVVLVAIVYFVSARYKRVKARKGKIASDGEDEELTEIQKAINAIESAQKIESGTTRKPAPAAGPIAEAAAEASESM